MKCRKCGSELRIEEEFVGVGDSKYSTTIGYCDKCHQRYDFTKEKAENNHSTLSIASLVLTLLTCTMPIGFIIGLVDIIKNDRTKKHIASWFSVCIGGIMVFLLMYKKPTEENTETPNISNQYAQETVLEADQEQKEGLQYSDLSESEYKQKCRTLYYDDVFFGEENLDEQLVKLDLLVSEGMFFTSEDMQKGFLNDFYYEHNLQRDFYKCCVKREGENSYVGQQITMFFTEDYNLDYRDFYVGQKITVYAEVVMWSDNTMDGYNSLYIIPRYYE